MSKLLRRAGRVEMTTAHDYANTVSEYAADEVAARADCGRAAQPHRRAACARAPARHCAEAARRSLDACRLISVGGAARERGLRIARRREAAGRVGCSRRDLSDRVGRVAARPCRIWNARGDPSCVGRGQPAVRCLYNDGGYRRGQTIGKRLLGIRAVSETGARISLGQAIVRQLPMFLQVYWIDVMFALFTERSQRAFEMLSKTRVVRPSW